MALELAQPVLRDRVRVGLAAGVRALSLQLERAADALHVDADHAGALALPPERGDCEPRGVAHLAVGPLANDLPDPLAQLLHVQPVAALVALVGQPALDGLLLDRAEEEAVEHEVEDAP